MFTKCQNYLNFFFLTIIKQKNTVLYSLAGLFLRATISISLVKSYNGQPYDVCGTLLKPHTNNNHRLHVDYYCTSILLCDNTLEKKIYVTGMIRVNRKGLPPQINKNKLLKMPLYHYIVNSYCPLVGWIENRLGCRLLQLLLLLQKLDA